MKSRGDRSVNGVSGGIVYPQAAQPNGANEAAATLAVRVSAFGRRCCLNSTVGLLGGYVLLVGGGVGGGFLYSHSRGLKVNEVDTQVNVTYGALTGLMVYAAGVCCAFACKKAIGARAVELVQEPLPMTDQNGSHSR
ncbi:MULTISPECIES: hypothetical protein [unclassified Endozoicomonas]|uniref:hypothetical protein n=1 Tax=unclassified Endozoicomonas TaxID=2644528 RepID=UPI003BB78F6C